MRAPALGVGKQTLVQRLEAMMPPAPASGSDDVAEHAQHGLTGPAQALPFLDQIQASFGRHDVRGVQAHVGGPAAEAAEAMGAQAYATGSSVAFGAAPDLHTAAHEAAHVVQQRGGVQLAGGVGRAGDPHERHADAVADRVVQGKSSADLLDAYAGGGGGGGVQQRAIPKATYAAYDEATQRQSTKSLLKAGVDEDAVIALAVEARALKARMDALKLDEFVAAKALAGSAALDADVALVTTAEQTVGGQVGAMIIAFTAAAAQAGPVPAPDKRIKDIKDRLAAAAAAITARDKPVMLAVLAGAVTVGKQLAIAQAARDRSKATVDKLNQESIELGKAKQAYQADVQVRADIDGSDLAQRAPGLGVAVPDVSGAYATAAGHAGQAKWKEASAASAPGRQQLTKMKGDVEQAEKDKKAYQDLRATFGLAALRQQFTDLHIHDPELTAAEAEATQASQDFGAQRWAAALAGARRVDQALTPLRAMVARFAAYTADNPPKLLQGKIVEIHQALAQAHIQDNARTLATLEATYRAQCTVSRENWLNHLGIAGENMVPNNPDYHYTTFNDSIPNPITVRVDNRTEAQLQAALFAAVDWHRQIHATLAFQGDRYHMYWDGSTSANVAGLQAGHPIQYQRLLTKFNDMVRDMTTGVRTAKANHGRVHHNNIGQQTAVVLA